MWRVAGRRIETKGRVSFLEATNLLWAVVLCRARVQAWVCMVDNFFWWLTLSDLLGETCSVFLVATLCRGQGSGGSKNLTCHHQPLPLTPHNSQS